MTGVEIKTELAHLANCAWGFPVTLRSAPANISRMLLGSGSGRVCLMSFFVISIYKYCETDGVSER